MRIPSLRGSGFVAAAVAVAAFGFASTGCSYVQARVEMKKGNESYNTEHFEEAVEHYRNTIGIDPTYKDAYLNMGLAYLSLYQPGSIHEKDLIYSREAIDAFKDYLRLDPGNEKVLGYLIEISQRSNNHHEAIKYFLDEHRRHPDDIRVISSLGNLYTRSGEIDAALEWLEKRLTLEPDNSEAYYTMGVTCWARSYNHYDMSIERRFEVLDRGIEALKRAQEIRPDYADAYIYENLILRQKAAFTTEPAKRIEWTNAANELLGKAQEIRQALQREAEEAAAATEAEADGI